jgi:putative membrane protein
MKKFIFIYCISLPIGLIPDFRIWAIPITMFIFYIMVSLEVLAEEIEDPFGLDENDLPTDEIADRIANNIREIAGQK